MFESPLDDVKHYNIQTTPKVLLHRRTLRLRKKIGLNMSTGHAPKMDLIEEEIAEHGQSDSDESPGSESSDQDQPVKSELEILSVPEID